jgi:hypothetical protein
VQAIGSAAHRKQSRGYALSVTQGKFCQGVDPSCCEGNSFIVCLCVCVCVVYVLCCVVLCCVVLCVCVCVVGCVFVYVLWVVCGGVAIALAVRRAAFTTCWCRCGAVSPCRCAAVSPCRCAAVPLCRCVAVPLCRRAAVALPIPNTYGWAWLMCHAACGAARCAPTSD